MRIDAAFAYPETELRHHATVILDDRPHHVVVQNHGLSAKVLSLRQIQF